MTANTPGALSGKDCKAYYNTGTHASPTWVLIARLQDAAMSDFGVNAHPANSRESSFEAHVAGLIKTGMTFSYLHYVGADTVRDAFTTMVTSRTKVEFAFMDADITYTGGTRGLRSFMIMEKFAQAQPLEGSCNWDGSLKPAYAVESSAKVDPDLYIIT